MPEEKVVNPPEAKTDTSSLNQQNPNFPEAFLYKRKQLEDQARFYQAKSRLERTLRLEKATKLFNYLKPFVLNRAQLETEEVFNTVVVEDVENETFVCYGFFLAEGEPTEEAVILFTVVISTEAILWTDAFYHEEPAYAYDLDSLQDVVGLRLAETVAGFKGPAAQEVDLVSNSEPDSSPDIGSGPEQTLDATVEPVVEESTDSADLIDLPAPDIKGTLGWLHLAAINPITKTELITQLNEFISTADAEIAYEILPAEEYFFSTDPNDPNVKLKSFRLLIWISKKMDNSDLEGFLLEGITSGYLSLEDAKATESTECVVLSYELPSEKVKAIAANIRRDF